MSTPPTKTLGYEFMEALFQRLDAQAVDDLVMVMADETITDLADVWETITTNPKLAAAFEQAGQLIFQAGRMDGAMTAGQARELLVGLRNHPWSGLACTSSRAPTRSTRPRPRWWAAIPRSGWST